MKGDFKIHLHNENIQTMSYNSFNWSVYMNTMTEIISFYD